MRERVVRWGLGLDRLDWGWFGGVVEGGGFVRVVVEKGEEREVG